MSEYLIQDTTLTGIGDKIRSLLGLSGGMSPEQMQTHLTTEQSNVTAALTALAEKGVDVPAGSNSNALAGLIAAIEAGGGDIKIGTMTPATSTKTVTIEHNFGSSYNFIAFLATDSVGAYSNCMFSVYAKARSATQCYSSYAYITNNDVGGRYPTIESTRFGSLCGAYTNDRFTLTMPEDNSILRNMVFGVYEYVWIVANI